MGLGGLGFRVLGLVGLGFRGFRVDNHGYSDSSNGVQRGMVLVDVVSYICERLPKVFVIEEVANFLHQHEAEFHDVAAQLNCVKRGGSPVYTVSWRPLNTLHYGGLPQNRPRLYIAGVPSDAREMVWPSEIPAKNIMEILEPYRAEDEAIPQSMTCLKNLQRLLEQLIAREGNLDDSY